MLTFIDVETSTHNKGHPFDPRNFLVSYSYKFAGDRVNFKYYTDPDFLDTLRFILEKSTVLVGFNIKFDLHWISRVLGGIRFTGEVYDCSLAEFILSGQTAGFISLNEALAQYGLETKLDAVAEYWDQGISTEYVPINILQEYNDWDVVQTEALRNVQIQLLSGPQQTLLMLEGEDLKTLQHAEYHGIKFDSDKASAKMAEYNEQVRRIELHLGEFLGDLPDTFQFNWDSGDHLSAFLYGGTLEYDYSTPETATYKTGPNKGQAYVRNRWYKGSVTFPQRFEPLEGSEVAKSIKNPDAITKFFQVDAPTLKQLKAKGDGKTILTLLNDRSASIKVVEMVESIMKKMSDMHWENSYIHPQFNQNVVVTGRLSSSAPNMQNTPVEVDELLISRYVD